MKTGILTDKNIKRLISSLKSKVGESSTPNFLLLPPTYRAGIDRTKYKGKGRPKKNDYILRDFLELFTPPL